MQATTSTALSHVTCKTITVMLNTKGLSGKYLSKEINNDCTIRDLKNIIEAEWHIKSKYQMLFEYPNAQIQLHDDVQVAQFQFLRLEIKESESDSASNTSDDFSSLSCNPPSKKNKSGGGR